MDSNCDCVLNGAPVGNSMITESLFLMSCHLRSDSRAAFAFSVWPARVYNRARCAARLIAIVSPRRSRPAGLSRPTKVISSSRPVEPPMVTAMPENSSCFCPPIHERLVFWKSSGSASQADSAHFKASSGSPSSAYAEVRNQPVSTGVTLSSIGRNFSALTCLIFLSSPWAILASKRSRQRNNSS